MLLLNVEDATLLARLNEKITTVAAVDSLWGIDLHEWDCIVTNQDYTTVDDKVIAAHSRYGYGREDDAERTWTWKQDFPDHISVIYAPAFHRGMATFELLDCQPRTGEDEDDLPLVVLVRDSVDGKHISYVEGLPPEITDLVQEHLVPVARDGRPTRSTKYATEGSRVTAT